MLSALASIREKAAAEQKRKADGQTSLFDNPDSGDNPGKVKAKDKLPDIDEFSHEELMALEKQLLGFYLTENPLEKVIRKLENLVSDRIFEIDPVELKGKRVKVGGIITSIRRVFTKRNNNEMAFVTIDDQTGKLDLVVFPKVFSRFKSLLVEDRVVLVVGTIDNRDDKISLLVEEIEEF